MAEKQYAFLEYDDAKTNHPVIRSGYCIKKAASYEYIEHEDVLTLTSFLEQFPDYAPKVAELLSQLIELCECPVPDEVTPVIRQTQNDLISADDDLPERRISPRLKPLEIELLFGETDVPVQLYSRQASTTGRLQDISVHGFSVSSYKKLPVDQEVSTSFKLGPETIASQAVVKNVSYFDGKLRLGLEFKNLSEKDTVFLHTHLPA